METQVASNFVKLEVSDNGAGFPDDLMARVFEPYVTTKAKGTGLGLAIVKKIVEEHNGSIQLTNKTTGGAMVTVSLPIADKKEGAQGESTAIFYE